METLQNVVFPNLHIPGDEHLYVRTNQRAYCERGAARVRFMEGGEISTDTLYGGLTVSAWKQIAPIRTLVLELEGQGEFIASIGIHRLGFTTRWLHEQALTLTQAKPTRLPLLDWERVNDGILFLRLRASCAGYLAAVRYQTADTPAHDVRLGLVITHFNRQGQVQPAMERLRKQVLQAAQTRGRVTLTVVDNSRNLKVTTDDKLRHIPNSNFGGSGGFARGLLALDGDGQTTHVLFMDDDASCEGESILRTFALLRYAASSRLAVAGALLDEAEPWRLLEKGACFDGKCRPLNGDKDMRSVVDLLWAERDPARPDYGGWWLFAFPLRELQHYPFPFFVRGDDVFFSLGNRFEIRTMNGIACLGESFRVKHGPLTAYLDGRYHLVHALMRERGRARMLRRLISNQFFKPLLGYHYASARAFTLAMRHVAQGPRFFIENMDLAKVRSQIATWTPSERMQPVPAHGLKIRRMRTGREKPLRALIRMLTLHGLLLPNALFSKRLLVHEKAFFGRSAAVFHFRRVLYEDQATATGYIAEYNRLLFFRELGAFLTVLRLFVSRMPALRREYSVAMERMTSREFWRDLYSIKTEVRGREQKTA